MTGTSIRLEKALIWKLVPNCWIHEGDRSAHPPVGMLPSHAPVYPTEIHHENSQFQGTVQPHIMREMKSESGTGRQGSHHSTGDIATRKVS